MGCFYESSFIKFLCGLKFSFLWDKCSKMWLLGYTVRTWLAVFFFFWKKLLNKTWEWLHHLTFQLAIYKLFSFFMSSLTSDIISFHLSILMHVVVFICIFLMVNNVEQFSCVHLSSISLLWWKFYLCLLPKF